MRPPFARTFFELLLEQAALLLYTSGSSSRPECVPLLHHAAIANGFNIGERQVPYTRAAARLSRGRLPGCAREASRASDQTIGR